MARQRSLPGLRQGADLTVSDLILAYCKHCEEYYQKDGEPTKELVNIKLALRPLRKLYGPTFARDYGPLSLKAVRDSMIAAEFCRNEVNKRISHIDRAFKWAVQNEIVPPDVHHGLRAVSGLRKRRSAARESTPVRPVPDAYVGLIRPHVNELIWTMIELQRLTGMRSGEVLLMRTRDLDTSERVWTYTPTGTRRSITSGHGRSTLGLGPRPSSGRGSGRISPPICSVLERRWRSATRSATCQSQLTLL